MDATILVPLLIEKLLDLLHDEATTSNNPMLDKKVQKAIDNLHSSKRYLKDAEDHEASYGFSSMNAQTIALLLKAVYSADDAIDNLIIRRELMKMRLRTYNNPNPSISSWRSLSSQVLFIREMKTFKNEFRRLSSCDHHLVEITKEKAVTSCVEYVMEDDTRLLNYFPLGGSQQQCWGRISGFCMKKETDYVVGFQQQINELLIQLIQDLDQSTHQVIAVVGKGGSGKTTLVRTVCDRVDVKRQFTIRVWVQVPSLFKARDLLAELLKQVHQTELVALEKTLSEDELMLRLIKLLSRTRYLIVLEDVHTPQVWETILKPLCLSSQFGGRIIVTTRNAINLPPEAAYSTVDVPLLNEVESWKLFLNKVQVANPEVMKNYNFIRQLKEQILMICAGLPLTIVLLGGLLSAKAQSYDEWSRVILQANNVGDILPLIYQDLPSEIKPCFLYMGLFPKGFEIPVRRLIHLWTAEGFLAPPDPELIDPEDLAEMCFEQLIIRNMVQVRWKLDGHLKTCYMPGVLHDVFTQKAEAAGFFTCQLGPSTKQSKITVRRLAAYFGIKDLCSSLVYNVQGLRSYVAFDTRMQGTAVKDTGTFLLKVINSRGFGLLNVLDLEGVYKPMLCDDVVGKLLHLSYLGLRSTFIDNLPFAVNELPYLETLDVKHTNIREIVLEAKKLRHLYLSQSCSCYLLSNEDFFHNLHTIWGLHIKDENLYLLHMLTRLRKLKLIAHVQDPLIAECVSKLTNLRSLKLISTAGLVQGPKKASNIELWTLAEHHKLQDLYLLGILQNFVIDVHFLPPRLRNLTLSLSQLTCDPMPVLGKLPHLNSLRLFGDSYVGQQITCLCGGFPKLNILKLWKLPLQEWNVEEGAMPCLSELEIRDCYNMKPAEGLKNVTTLEELVLTNMPMAFGTAVQGILQDRNVFIKTNTWCSAPWPE